MPAAAECVGSGPTRRILQVHPTLRCNMRCGHCYSTSGPDARDALDLSSLCSALADAQELGYETLSVSGGEPFVYRELPELLGFAKSIGLSTAVTSNGSLLGHGRLERVREHLDGLALSVDGPRAEHNRMRASPRAFERLLAGIEIAKECEIPFAFIHTLTEQGWPQLPWIADFAAEHGAQLLQIHPLELVGRAETHMSGEAPAQDTTERVYLLVKALEAHYANDFAVQFDVLLRSDILADPELVYATPHDERIDSRAADLLGSLVVEADGAVVPISYGFSRAYAIANLHERGIAASWPAWERDRQPGFRALCRSVFADIRASEARLVNWHDLIVARSHVEVAIASS